MVYIIGWKLILINFVPKVHPVHSYFKKYSYPKPCTCVNRSNCKSKHFCLATNIHLLYTQLSVSHSGKPFFSSPLLSAYSMLHQLFSEAIDQSDYRLNHQLINCIFHQYLPPSISCLLSKSTLHCPVVSKHPHYTCFVQ